MNILYHHRTQGKGVERVHILGIVEAWRNMGHKVDILSPPGIEIEKTQHIDKNENVSATTRWWFLKKINFKLVFELLEVFYNFWAVPHLKKGLMHRKYDMIFERYSFLCWAGAKVAKQNNIPFFLEVNYLSATPIFRKRSRFIQVIERYIESRILRMTDGIIVVSSHLEKLLVSEGIPKEKILVLPNAADPEKFNPEIDKQDLVTRYQLRDKKVVGFIGYFYPWHGIDQLIQAFSLIKTQLNDVLLLLIGDGPTFDDIRATVKELKLENNILLTGRVSHSEIQKYIALFDIAVMPDSNNYGSPMKILEYMAMEKAVLAPRLEPLEDVILDGHNGLLFTPGDVNLLYERIKDMLINDQLRLDLGRNARKSIIDTNNWHSNAKKILDLYHKI